MRVCRSRSDARVARGKNSAAGIPVLLGFTFFMGLMLSRMIGMVLGFKNGSELIMTAFAGTAGVFLVMASLATVIKRDLSGMGKFLFVGVLVLFVGSIINVASTWVKKQHRACRAPVRS
jgi:modulator of FtsH protease